MDLLRSILNPDPKLIINAIKSVVVPHYIINIFLACSFYVLKSVSPFCEYLFDDCSIDLVSLLSRNKGWGIFLIFFLHFITFFFSGFNYLNSVYCINFRLRRVE